jgi:multidrug resistance efflux pump
MTQKTIEEKIDKAKANAIKHENEAKRQTDKAIKEWVRYERLREKLKKM